jgi:hypothetical protein
MKAITTAAFSLLFITAAQAIEVSPDQVEVTQENRVQSIAGKSCKNFIFNPTPTIEKALADLMGKAAQKGAKKISAPSCKETPHAGVGVQCGTYWSQVVCESVILE